MSNKYNGEERRQNMDWHLTKSISISVIILLLLNLSTSIWWLSGLNSDVGMLKAKPDLLERVINLEARANEHGRIITRFDVTLDKINNTIIQVSNELSRRKPFADAVEHGFYKKQRKE
ncbi:hypothetical protein MNBD_GAMMA08-1809 [hydrothermal vent metagenome]|uniref:Uncharacterized protein n=1 Tax=hydrothermal vent metagenome TaxID=652676 RepID=A0A3B0X3L6_9ZZZZ